MANDKFIQELTEKTSVADDDLGIIRDSADPNNDKKLKKGTEKNYYIGKQNLTATSDPTITDDSSAGYEVRSQWFNVSAATAWLCMDATVGAAVWKDITQVGSTIATEPEAIAGTDNTKVMTPLRVKQAIDANDLYSVELSENLTAADVVKIINDGGTAKAKKISAAVSGTGIFDAVGSNTTDIAMKACLIDTDRILIVFDRNTTSGSVAIKGIVGTISGNSLSFGSDLTLSVDGSANKVPSCAYDPIQDKAVVIYGDNDNTQTRALVLTITGTSIAIGAEVTVDTDGAVWTDVIWDANNSAFIFLWCTDIATPLAKARSGVIVAGPSITFGSTVTVGNDTDATKWTIGDSDIPVIAYNEAANGRYRTIQVSGTAITLGSENTFGGNLDITDGYKFDIAYNSIEGQLFFAWIDATTPAIWLKSEDEFIDLETDLFPDTANFVTMKFDRARNRLLIMTHTASSTATLAEIKFINNQPFVDRFQTYSFTGDMWATWIDAIEKTLIVGQSASGSATSGRYALYDASDVHEAIGVLQETGSAGETKIVAPIGEKSVVHSSLVMNAAYFLDESGSLSLVKSNNPIGRAADDTTLILTKSP